MQFASNEDFDWPESSLQEAAAMYLQFLEDRGWLTFQHSPLGGKRDKWTGRKMKRHGAKKGQPDLDVFLLGGKTVFFELKTWTGVISKAQIARHDLLRKLGFDVHIILGKTPAHTVDQIARILRNEYGIREAQ